MLYIALLVPFNDLDRGDKADQRGLNPDLLAKFPQAASQGFARFHHPAGQRIQALARRLARAARSTAAIAKHRHGGGEDRAATG